MSACLFTACFHSHQCLHYLLSRTVCVCGVLVSGFDISNCFKMVKGGKRYSSMSNDGKWFAHQVLPENETRSRETSTSTGIMLTQAQSALPQALNFKRYPKWKTQQESREYPLSDHDNKHALKDHISVFADGVGRRKSLDDRRQQISHFCLCHDGAYNNAEGTGGNTTAYQTDFMVKQAVNGPTSTRRFPRNHKQKSAEAALASAGEQFMWFGRHDSTTYSAPSKPRVDPTFKARDHIIEGPLHRGVQVNFLGSPAVK